VVARGLRKVAPAIGAVALALCSALSAAAAGDERTPPPENPAAAFGDALEVTVVNVEVFVRDREGRPVADLGPEDFRLLQDGAEVEVSNFALLGGAEGLGDGDAAGGALSAPGGPEARRAVNVVLFVDNVNLVALQRNRVIERMKTFVEESLAPPVRMMVVTSQPRLAVRLPFTDDRAAVLGVLEQLAAESAGRLRRDRDRREILDWMEEIARDPRMDTFEFLQSMQVQVLKVQVQAQILAYVEQEADILEDSLTGLYGVLRMVGELEGRRLVIHVSNGLPMTPGLDLLHEFQQVFQDGTIFSRIAQRDFTAELRALTEAASARGVALYAIDASGLGTPEGFGADDRSAPRAMASSVNMKNLQETLGFMADTTGGLAVLNTNDVSLGLARIRDDLSSAYSLGYAFAPSGRDLKHELAVELPGRPELRVRHRKWFVEKSPATRMRERVASALVLEPDDNPMRIVLSFGESVAKDGRHLEIPLRVSIPLASLEWSPGELTALARLELVVGTRDARGRVAVPQPVLRELRIPASELDSEPAQRVGLVVPLLVEAPPSAVAVGVRDLGSGLSSCVRLLAGGV
jgi:VWFA-related protein